MQKECSKKLLCVNFDYLTSLKINIRTVVLYIKSLQRSRSNSLFRNIKTLRTVCSCQRTVFKSAICTQIYRYGNSLSDVLLFLRLQRLAVTIPSVCSLTGTARTYQIKK